MSEYIDLSPTTVTNETEEKDPIRIQYGDVKMRLPRLDDTRHLPLSVTVAGINAASRGWDNLEPDEQIQLCAVILTWLLKKYPRLESELDRKSSDQMLDIARIFKAWAEATAADPKA